MRGAVCSSASPVSSDEPCKSRPVQAVPLLLCLILVRKMGRLRAKTQIFCGRKAAPFSCPHYPGARSCPWPGCCSAVSPQQPQTRLTYQRLKAERGDQAVPVTAAAGQRMVPRGGQTPCQRPSWRLHPGQATKVPCCFPQAGIWYRQSVLHKQSVFPVSSRGYFTRTFYLLLFSQRNDICVVNIGVTNKSYRSSWWIFFFSVLTARC